MMNLFSFQFANTGIPPIQNDQEIVPNEDSTFFLFDLVQSFGQSSIVPAYSWGIIIITSTFVVGALMMILSALFKNGQWQKFGQNSMFWSFITLLLMRGMPILILSIRNTNDVDLLLQEFIITLSYSAIYLGVISIAASGLFKMGHKLIGHPEFYRRSRTLVMVSVIMVALSLGIPKIFPQI